MTETYPDKRVPAWHVVKTGDAAPDSVFTASGMVIPIGPIQSKKKLGKNSRKKLGNQDQKSYSLPPQPTGYIKAPRYEFF